METISNIATTATSTVSNIIYGDSTKNNETAGKEPVSGKEGKGTASDPYDQGNLPTPFETAATEKSAFIDESKKDNEFLKLNPEVDGPKKSEGTTTTTTSPETSAITATGMPIIPLNPDAATSSGSAKTDAKPSEPTGVTDKVWKETPLDDISRSAAPGAGPEAPATSVPVSSETPQASGTTKETATESVPVVKESKKEEEKLTSGDVSPKTSTDATKPSAASEPKGVAEKKSSDAPSEEGSKGSKMSHFKDKLKGKLHIGSKDK